MIAALALDPGRPLGSDQLVEAVWGEGAPSGARTTLQTYISRLRGSLGEDAIVHGPGGYRLAEGTSCDTQVARRLADEARASLAESPRRAVDVAKQALSLWQGSPFGDVADSAWFAPEIAGLEELRSNLIDVLGAALTADHRPQEAVELLEPATREQPLREPTSARLIDALVASGRHNDAVRAASRYRRQLADETGLEPGAELQAAEQRALTGDVTRSHSALASATTVPGLVGATLPRAGPLFGREDALDALVSAAAVERLVSICGPGGVGKTRLAAELVARHGSSPVVVVELAPVRRGDAVTAVASALHLRADRATATDVAEHLGDASVLVVLDNAEHVIDETRSLARALLDRCAGVRLVITSRIRTGLPDEWVHVVGPLSTLGEPSPAAQLFTDRVERSGRIGALDTADPMVREICERLDGLPLALELAAGRAAALDVRALRDRLEAALDLVAARGVASRHDSLRSVVAWSYDLLDDPERQLLRALAVFEGEFDIDDAESIGSRLSGESMGMSVSALLARLVDASLVAASATPSRYRLLEMIRQFAREQLDVSGEQDAVRRLHAEWVWARTATLAEALGPSEATISAQFDALRVELHGALRWTAANGDRELAARLLSAFAGPLLYRPDADLIDASVNAVRQVLDQGNLLAVGARLAFVAGALDDAETFATRALARTETDLAARHRAHHALGVRRLYQGRHAEAAQAFMEVSGDPAASTIDRLDTLGGLGLALCYQGSLDEARRVIEQHEALATTVDSPTYRAFAQYMWGEHSLALGATDRGVRQLRDAAELAWSVGATFIWGIASTVLAVVLVRDRPTSEARAHLPLLLERCRNNGTWTQAWTTMRLVAELLAREDAPDVAALIVTAAKRDAAAPLLTGDDLERVTALEHELRETLGASTFEGISAGAATLSRVDVLTRALDALHKLDRD